MFKEAIFVFEKTIFLSPSLTQDWLPPFRLLTEVGRGLYYINP